MLPSVYHMVGKHFVNVVSLFSVSLERTSRSHLDRVPRYGFPHTLSQHRTHIKKADSERRGDRELI